MTSRAADRPPQIPTPVASSVEVDHSRRAARQLPAHLLHNSCTEAGTHGGRRKNSPPFTAQKKTSKPHQCADYKYSASVDVSTPRCSSNSRPVVHGVTQCEGKKQAPKNRLPPLRTAFFTLTFDLLPEAVWVSVSGGCAAGWRFMVGPGPTDPRDQGEPSAGRKSAAPHARQESDPPAAVGVLHEAANVTSRRQHRGPRPPFPCPKYRPVL